MKTVVKNTKEAKRILFDNGINIYFKKFNNYGKIFVGNWTVELSSSQCGCGETLAYYAYNFTTNEDLKIAICEHCQD